jgi:ElaB/YqjD/DUF883 family membrane-anchored ribosome-binding protein
MTDPKTAQSSRNDSSRNDSSRNDSSRDSNSGNESSADRPSARASARGTMEQTYRSAKDTAAKALDSTRVAASDTARRAVQGIEDNPVAVLAGGIAIGMLAGAFLPTTEQERKLAGPVGKRLTDTASGAVQAAKEAGFAELDGLGISKQAARDQVGKLIGGVLQALASAGEAAAQSAQNQPARK